MTRLVPVTDWGWDRYRASYWRDEAHFNSGEPAMITREFVESEGGADSFLFGYEGERPEGGWPEPRAGHGMRAGYASYEVIQENVASTLVFQSGGRMGGTRVIGTGWQDECPAGWLGQGRTF